MVKLLPTTWRLGDWETEKLEDLETWSNATRAWDERRCIKKAATPTARCRTGWGVCVGGAQAQAGAGNLAAAVHPSLRSQSTTEQGYPPAGSVIGRGRRGARLLPTHLTRRPCELPQISTSHVLRTGFFT
jgi:hypothetical protein